MERRRTWGSFLRATGIGLGLTLVLLVGGEILIAVGWSRHSSVEHPLTYVLIGVEGLAVGAVLGRLFSYYPALEGFVASLFVPWALVLWAEVRDAVLDFFGFEQLLLSLVPIERAFDLDTFVELVLKFEAHFACLCLSSFLFFMARGGGHFYPRFVGLRYLRFKMITGITVVGVALGVAGLTVVLSVMSGFETDLKGKIIGTNAHAIIQKRGLDFIEYHRVLETIRRVPGVVAATPFVYNEVMVSSEYNIAGVFIRGIDTATAGSVTELTIQEGSLAMLARPETIDAYLDALVRRSLPEPSELFVPSALGDRPARAPGEGSEREEEAGQNARVDPVPKAASSWKERGADEVPMPEPLLATKPGRRKVPGILIGAELKKGLRVRVGDRINVVSPLSEELGPTGPVPKARSFRVAGVFYTGMYEYDAKSVYVTLDAAQAFFGLGDAVTGIALKLGDIDRAQAICDRLVSALDGYPFFARTWYQMNKNLFSALKMEKVGMFIVLVIVILVSAFGIISTLIMLVWEKVKEIAILKSMGATGDGVMKIFMIEGITIGMVGTGLGLILGWVVCTILQGYGLQLDPEVYYIEALPVNMDPVEFVLIAGIALHISFIATIYPSRRASRLRPVEGLRYD